MKSFEEKKLLYNAASNRLKNAGITDPTSIIAELESEIRYYRTELKKIDREQRLHHIESVIGKINQKSGEITKEDKEYLYVTNLYGTHKYSKLQLAIFWLTHSNDRFYETFGFSWVPSDRLQNLARKEINEGTNITIGIDMSSGNDIQVNHVMPVPESILKDILTNIKPIDVVRHHSFTSFHTK